MSARSSCATPARASATPPGSSPAGGSAGPSVNPSTMPPNSTGGVSGAGVRGGPVKVNGCSDPGSATSTTTISPGLSSAAGRPMSLIQLGKRADRSPVAKDSTSSPRSSAGAGRAGGGRDATSGLRRRQLRARRRARGVRCEGGGERDRHAYLVGVVLTAGFDPLRDPLQVARRRLVARRAARRAGEARSRAARLGLPSQGGEHVGRRSGAIVGLPPEQAIDERRAVRPDEPLRSRAPGSAHAPAAPVPRPPIGGRRHPGRHASGEIRAGV